MTGKEMLEALSYIDDELVEEAKMEIGLQPVKKKSYNWAAVIIVALFFVVGGTAVAVSGKGKFSFADFFAAPEKGYIIQMDMERFARSDFKGEVLEVEGFIRKQIAEYEPYMSQMPNHWIGKFDSLEEVDLYLGLEAFINPEWYMEEQGVTLSIRGDEQGQFEHISIDTIYQAEDMIMQSFVHIMTENTDDDTFSLSNITQNRHLAVPYTNENGNECMIIGSTTAAGGYWTKDGYVVVDGILYYAHVAYKTGQEEQAIQILREWLDMY